MPGMHAGNLATSTRLQKLETFLRLRGTRGATSIEITNLLKAAAASTDASELRRNLRARGEDVVCTPEGRTADGRKIYRFRIQRIDGHEVGGGTPLKAAKPEAARDLLSNPPPPSPEPSDQAQLKQGDLFGRTG